MIFALLSAALFIECENFADKGGWTLDPSSTGEMGSSYLMAHGYGVAVKDASTSFTVEKPGPRVLEVKARRQGSSLDAVLTLRKAGSYLQGHPNMNTVPGVDMSTGSLGQGISVAVGMAIGAGFGNISIGMCFGVAIGVFTGAALDAKSRKKEKNISQESDEEKVDL